MVPMSDTLPAPIPGPVLAERRRQVGIPQVALARRLGVHRVTLNGWENAHALDGVRAAKYERALHELAAEAVA
jgi:transcriptional regulator with XRE-family HTH domain